MTDLILDDEMRRLMQMIAQQRQKVIVRAIEYPVERAIPHAAGRPVDEVKHSEKAG